MALAIAVVLVMGLGIDAFLSTVQRVTHMLDEQDKAAELKRVKQPMPAYVIPAEQQPQRAP